MYEQLLDALHQYDLFTNPEQQLQRGIHQCNILLQHGLFTQCEKRIRSLSKLAEQMNHYEAQLQLQQLKMMMKARKYYRHEKEETLSAWRDDTMKILADMEITTRYRYLSSLVYKMQYDAGGRGKELAMKMKDIVALPEFSNERKASTLRAHLDYLQVRALYHFTNSETEKASIFNQKFLHLLEENPLLMQVHADRYFSVLNNYLIDCLLMKKYDLLASGLTKLRGLPKKPAFRRLINFEANVFRLGYLLELNYRIATGDFTKAYSELSQINSGLDKYGEKIVKHNRITLQYLMAYIAFALGKYDEALDFIQPILQEKETAVAEDVQLAAKMLQLLCHFERGETLLLDSLIKSLRRVLKRDENTSLQKTVLSFIQTSLKKLQITKVDWVSLQKKIFQGAKKKSSASGFNLFDYRVWVQTHSDSISFVKAWQNMGLH